MIIRNYGLFWERDKLAVGKKGSGNRGELLGYSKGDKAPTDFRDQSGIYVLYEGSSINTHRVVYIGQTGAGNQRLLARLRQHTNDHLWNRWQRFSWLGFLAIGNNKKPIHKKKAALGNIAVAIGLDQIEASLISLLDPLLNRQGPQWHGAVEYYQGKP
jgi:uncharacterized protein (UPF0248 family)